MKILYIDDEVELQEEIADILHDSGHEVVRAQEGLEAIKILGTYRPDLILCDVSMPKMDGPTLLKSIRKDFPDLANIPFIFLTAFSSDQDMMLGLELGADDYLTKPIDFAKLEAKIRAAVRIRDEYEARLHHQANFDALTGLPNWARALEILTNEIKKSDELGVTVNALTLSFDNFRQLNSSLGRDVGDSLLKKVAHILQKRLADFGDFDTQLCHLNADEFLMVLTSTHLMDCSELVVRVVFSLFETEVDIGDHAVLLKPSIGIAKYQGDGVTAGKLINNASLAMSNAQASDGPAYRYHLRKLDRVATEDMEMEQYIRRALKENEFHLFYQPVVEVSSGRTIGAEALLRWDHPLLGAVPPDKFIPVAERTGDIVPIGEWVLRTACQQAKEWSDSCGWDLRMAVNFSPRQFESVAIIETVHNALNDSGLTVQSLEIEVTERLLMADTPVKEVIFDELNETGVRLSIDDFGTGFSSLSLLKEFPFDTVKIDRSFVMNVLENRKDASMIRSIISMAHGMDLEIIAEGVETMDQLAFLRDQKCDYIQGYYYSKPIPANEFLQFIQSNRSVAQTNFNMAIGAMQ